MLEQLKPETIVIETKVTNFQPTQEELGPFGVARDLGDYKHWEWIMPHELPLVAHIDPHRLTPEMRQRWGYRAVRRERFMLAALYARSWAWPLLKASSWFEECWFSALSALYRRRVIVITTPPMVVTRKRDLRPNLWPFNRGCRRFEGSQ
jgi:hypothetical protein